MPLREENDRLQRTLDDTRRSLEHSTATLQAQTYESNRLKKSTDAQIESLRLELHTSEDRVVRLQAALEEERSMRREYEDKAKRCQSAEEEAKSPALRCGRAPRDGMHGRGGVGGCKGKPP